ncbi:MAG: radical SAM protein [Clostridia bacterium]|nr:radical SAM protein [Clostridia bacterium]
MAEASIKQYLFRKAAAKRIPVSGSFELTPRCNMRCKMCYIARRKDDAAALKGELSREEWLRLGREAASAGMVYLLLTGGEPLLRPDFLSLYSDLASLGLMLSVNTNATLVNEDVAECLRRFPPETVNVTLYGMSADTYGRLSGAPGGFDAAVRGILMLRDAGIRLTLNTTFTKANVCDLDAIVAFAKEEKIPVRMNAYLFPPVRKEAPGDEAAVFLTPEEAGEAAARFDLLTLTDEVRDRRRSLIRTLRKGSMPDTLPEEGRISSCMAGRGSFWITWEGKMYACGMMTEHAVDVRKMPFTEAWQLTAEYMSHLRLPPECLVCPYGSICASCAAVTLATEGASDKKPEALCRRTEAYARAFTE